jgi:hypothetical protein
MVERPWIRIGDDHTSIERDYIRGWRVDDNVFKKIGRGKIGWASYLLFKAWKGGEIMTSIHSFF